MSPFDVFSVDLLCRVCYLKQSASSYTNLQKYCNPINTLLTVSLHLLSQKKIQFKHTGRLSCHEPGKRLFWFV